MRAAAATGTAAPLLRGGVVVVHQGDAAMSSEGDSAAQAVDPPRELEVVLASARPRSAWSGVTRDLVPAWITRSGWWFISSATGATRLTKLDRAREVVELEGPRDRVAVALPAVHAGQPLLDLLVAQTCHPRLHAHRLARPLGHRDAVRPRPRRRGRRRHARVRLPAGGARPAPAHARRDRPGACAPAEIDRAVRERDRARASRSTSSTSARCASSSPT